MAVARRKSKIDNEPRPFLDVVNSARGYVWRERLSTADHAAALAISQRHDLPEVLGRVLAAREVGLDEVPTVLDPTIKALMPDPSTLRDMDAAAERLARAIETGERVAIFGDYDVDGASSSALLKRFFAMHGQDAIIYIPDRLAEGYGPNARAIEGLVEQGARLIVCVDCGTTSHAPLAAGRAKGADIVVIDHHQADEALPVVTALVNPNRQDDISGLGHLCAAGVVFMTLVATQRVLRQRGFYANGREVPALLGTARSRRAGDGVRRRAIEGAQPRLCDKGPAGDAPAAQHGAQGARRCGGSVSRRRRPYALGFVLGPRINAGGRIGDAALGAEAVVGRRRHGGGPDRRSTRQAEQGTQGGRDGDARRGDGGSRPLARAGSDTALSWLGSERWHKGVVGLVASRLVGTVQAAVVCHRVRWQRSGTGSLRSVAGVDIGTARARGGSRGLLIKGGGHAMAAGLTVLQGKACEPLRRFLAERLRNGATEAQAAAGLEIDGALDAGVGQRMNSWRCSSGRDPTGREIRSPGSRSRRTASSLPRSLASAHIRARWRPATARASTPSPSGPWGSRSATCCWRPTAGRSTSPGQLQNATPGAGGTRSKLLIDDVADPQKTGLRRPRGGCSAAFSRP